eukprot:scaffold49358_cov20-Tisochrysis_lutea.AAC.1
MHPPEEHAQGQEADPDPRRALQALLFPQVSEAKELQASPLLTPPRPQSPLFKQLPALRGQAADTAAAAAAAAAAATAAPCSTPHSPHFVTPHSSQPALSNDTIPYPAAPNHGSPSTPFYSALSPAMPYPLLPTAASPTSRAPDMSSRRALNLDAVIGGGDIKAYQAKAVQGLNCTAHALLMLFHCSYA